jgi:hypothetical protein
MGFLFESPIIKKHPLMAKKIKLAVKAMASNDDTVVVWHYTEFIKDKRP